MEHAVPSRTISLIPRPSAGVKKQPADRNVSFASIAPGDIVPVPVLPPPPSADALPVAKGLASGANRRRSGVPAGKLAGKNTPRVRSFTHLYRLKLDLL